MAHEKLEKKKKRDKEGIRYEKDISYTDGRFIDSFLGYFGKTMKICRAVNTSQRYFQMNKSACILILYLAT